MSNKKTLPVAFNTPNIRFLPKTKKDIPVVSKYLDSEIILREDMLRKLAILRGSSGNIIRYRMNFYYNLLLSLFDIDEIEVCIYSLNGDEKVLNTVSIEEKLSPREQEIINYIRGIIKYARESENFSISPIDEISSPRDKSNDNTLEKAILEKLFSSRKEEDLHPQEWRVGTLKDKFPEANLIEGKLYIHSYSLYSDNSRARENDRIYLPVPLTRDYSEIIKMSQNNTRDVSDFTGFQDACYESLENKTDPMQSFIKSNLFKSPVSNEQTKPVKELDKKVISAFIREAEIISVGNLGLDSRVENPSSGLMLATAVSNLKKASFDFSVNSSENLELSSIKIKLVKIKGEEREVYKVFDTVEAYNDSKKYFDTQKLGNLGDIPVQFERREDSTRRTVVISREQLHDNRISSFNCNRVVSRMSKLNGSFVQVDTNENPVTDVLIDNSGIINLNRTTLLNTHSGEFKVKSSVIHKGEETPNVRSAVRSEETLEKIVLTKFCISNQENGSPVNVLRMFNVPSGVRISEVLCTPEIGNSAFKIPFKVGDRDIVHADPLPGVRYTYEISFHDDRGIFHRKFMSTKILTLPPTPNEMILEDMGIVTDDSNNRLLKIVLPKGKVNNYAIAVSSTLDNIFSSSERDFYNDEFKSKLKENFRNIGKSFELFVSYFAKDDGELLEDSFIGISEEHSDEENFVFLIPTDIQLEDYVLNYNLILTNPVDLINLREEIQDENSKKFFTRATSKFFATSGKNNGVIPVLVRDPNTGDEVYHSNSRYSVNSKFSRMVCSGGYTDIELSLGVRRHYLSTPTVSYNVDDGDFILNWRVNRVSPGFRKETYLDFFIITAVVGSREVPVTAYPFLGFTSYKVRTPSMMGVSSSVKFKIYPVYHDFSIDFDNVLETDTRKVRDIRVKGSKVL